MAQQIIDIGAAPNDGKGDPVRVAFNKVNQNFAELYRNSGGATTGTGYAGSRGYMGYVGSSGYSGSQGPVGPQGIGIRLLGRVATYTSLPTVGNSVGDAWFVAGDSNVYLWDTASSTWSNIGQIVGYSGSVGLTGYTGSRGTGYTGSTGYRGSSGTIGYTGSTGVGYTGSVGTGYTGSVGTGYTGSAGSSSSLVNGSKTAYLGSTGMLTVPGSIVPDTNITYDLGSATNRFRDIYLSGSTINLGGTAVSVNSSGQLSVSESYINVSLGNVTYAAWTTNAFSVTVALALAAKFDSLKVGDTITLLTGVAPANTVLTLTGPATGKTLVQGNLYYDYLIPVNSSPSTVPSRVDTFTITRGTGSNVSSLVNGARTLSLGTNGNLTLPSGSQLVDTPTGVQISGAGQTAVNRFYTKLSDTLYETVDAGVTYRLINQAGTWSLDVVGQDNPRYTSTNLITWVNAGGGLPAPTGTLITGSANITVNSKTWAFSTTGNTTFPTGLVLGAPRGVNTVNFTCAVDKEFQIETGTATTGRLWSFSTTGNTTFPSGLLFHRLSSSYSNITADLDKVLQIATQTSGGRKEWSFSTTGSLTFPDGTNQSTAWTGTFPAPANGDSTSGNAWMTFYADGAWQSTSRLTINPATSMLTINGDNGVGGITLPRGGIIKSSLQNELTMTVIPGTGSNSSGNLGHGVDQSPAGQWSDNTTYPTGTLCRLTLVGATGDWIQYNNVTLYTRNNNGTNIVLCPNSTLTNTIDVVTGTFASGTLTLLSDSVAIQSNSSTWNFGTTGELTLPKGSTIGETATTTVITPPGAAPGYSWEFDANSALKLPNAGELRPSTAAYDAALAGWESIRAGYITTTISDNLIPPGGWPMVNWYPTGATAQGYIDFLLNARTLQSTPGATLIIQPPMSTAFYYEMRASLIAIRDSYNASTKAVSLSSAYGKSWNFGADGKLTLPGGLPGTTSIINSGGFGSIGADGSSSIAWTDSDSNPTQISAITADGNTGVVIQAGAVAGGPPVPDYQWTFGTDGKLTLPNGTAISDINDNISLVMTQSGPPVNDGHTAHFIDSGASPNKFSQLVRAGLLVNGPGVTNGVVSSVDAAGMALTITGGVFQTGASYVITSPSLGSKLTVNSKDWKFGNDGNLTFPNATVQTTAWTGSVSSLVNGSKTVSLGSDGNLTFADAGGSFFGSGFLQSGTSGINVGIKSWDGRQKVFVNETNVTIQAVSNSSQAYNWTFGKDGTTVFPSNTVKSATDAVLAITTGESVDATQTYNRYTDFSTNVTINGTLLLGWYQRNSQQIEFALFGPSAFVTYVTGVSVGRTMTVVYETSSGQPNQFTGTITQAFTNQGQYDPAHPTWVRVSGRVDGTLPSNQTGIRSIGFPLTNTVPHTWQFGTDGTTTFPDGYLKIVPNGANPYIGNNTFADLGGGDSQSTVSAISINQSVADNAGINIDTSVTNSLSGGTYLAAGSSMNVNGTRIVLGQYTVNSLGGGGPNLFTQNKIEINNNATLIGQYVSNTAEGNTITSFTGWTFGTNGNLTLPLGGVIADGSSGSGVGHGIHLKPQGGSATQELIIYPTGSAADGDHVHLTAGGGATELYLGNDLQYVKLVNGGNVQVQASTANFSAHAAWNFSTDGKLALPNNGKITSGVGTAQVGSTTTIALNDGGGQAAYDVTWAGIAWTGNESVFTTYAAGSTITFANGDVRTITEIQKNMVEEGEFTIDIYWSGSRTLAPNLAFPITLKTSNYAAAYTAPEWQFGTNGSLTLPDASVISSYKPVTVIAQSTSTRTIANNASAAFIQFVDTVDTANSYSADTFTVPYTGYYQVNLSIYFSTSVTLSSGSLFIDTNLDNAKVVTIFNGAWSGSYLHYSTVIPATTGDSVRVAIRQVSGASIDLASGCRLTIHRVSIS